MDTAFKADFQLINGEDIKRIAMQFTQVLLAVKMRSMDLIPVTMI